MAHRWRSELPSDVEFDCPVEDAPRVPTLGLHMEQQDYVDGSLGLGMGKERVDSMFDSGLDSINSMYLKSSQEDEAYLSQTQTQLSGLSLEHPSTDLTQTQSLTEVQCASLLDEGFVSGRGLSELSHFTENSTEIPTTLSSQPQIDRDTKALHIFTRDEDGDTQLHMAIIHGHSAIAMEMIDLALEPEYLNMKNDLHQTPLHLAVCTSQPDVTRKLVSRGAQVDIRDRHGNTALHLACQNGDIACVEALTRPISHQEIKTAPYNATFQRIPQDPEIKNYEGETCLHLAAKGAYMEVFIYLISNHFGSNINARDGRSGRTALHHAVESRNMNTLTLLLHLKTVDVNVRTFDGSTPLKLATGRGYQDLAQVLIQRGAEIMPVTSESDSDSNYDSEEESMDTKYDDLQIGGQPISMS